VFEHSLEELLPSNPLLQLTISSAGNVVANSMLAINSINVENGGCSLSNKLDVIKMK